MDIPDLLTKPLMIEQQLWIVMDIQGTVLALSIWLLGVGTYLQGHMIAVVF